MKQDYNGVRTAQDLERKYDFTQLEKVNEINNNIIQANKNILTTNMNNEIKLFVEAVTKYMDDYSVDGNITTYYYSGIPSLNNLPTSEWTTDEEKNNHIWDLYYNKETGYVYMFTLEDETYSWQRLEDYDVEKALALANAARDTQDNKRRLFLTQPTPPYDSGDMWKNGDEILICQIGKPSGETYAERDFIIDSKYVDNTVATEVNNKLTVLSGSVLEIENGVDRYSRTLNQTIKVVDEHGNYIGDRSGKTTTITQDLDGFNLSIGAWDSSKGSLSKQTADIRADINGLRSEIGNVTDVTITKEGNGTLYFNGETESVNESNPISMHIYPTTENISRVYPSYDTYPTTQDYPQHMGLVPNNTLTPSNSLVPATGRFAQKIKYPTELYIDFYNETEDEHITYPFPTDLRRLDDYYDEFVYDYENQTCKVLRRITVDEYGQITANSIPTEEDLEFPDIHLTDGKYVISFVPFNTPYMKMVLMSQNMYTSQFATKVELNGKYEFTYDHFTAEVSKKITGFDADGNPTDDVISSINLVPGTATISADKVNINGVITAINGETSTTIDGNKITTGTITANQIAANTIEGNKIKANTIEGTHIKANTIDAENIKADAITTDKIATGAVTANEITTGAITTAKLATLAVTTDKIAANTITGDKIQAGSITGDKLDINGVITSINNNSTTTINGNKITTGTLSANTISGGTINGTNVNITNLDATNISSGTLSGASINVGGNTYYLRMGKNWTKNPEVSGLNVGNKGVNVNGLGFNTDGSTFTFAGGVNTPYLRATSDLRVDRDATIYGVFKANQIKPGGYLQIATGGRTGYGTNPGSIYLYSAAHITINAASGHFVYIGNANVGNDKAAVDNKGPSSRCLKKNIKAFKKTEYDDALKLLDEIKLYDYEYKYDIHPKKEQYGFIIDELLDNKLADKFLYFKDEKAKVNAYNRLDYLLETKEDEEKAISFKRYDEETLIKYLLVVCKALQKKVEKLESRE